MIEPIEYFDQQIKDKLKQIPRAIDGNAPKEVIEKILEEIYLFKKCIELFSLNSVVASLPSKDEKLIGNMCLSYRHDFGLLSEQEMNKLMNECKNWLISYENNRK